jgi:hypothetical protein
VNRKLLFVATDIFFLMLMVNISTYIIIIKMPLISVLRIILIVTRLLLSIFVVTMVLVVSVVFIVTHC